MKKSSFLKNTFFAGLAATAIACSTDSGSPNGPSNSHDEPSSSSKGCGITMPGTKVASGYVQDLNTCTFDYENNKLTANCTGPKSHGVEIYTLNGTLQDEFHVLLPNCETVKIGGGLCVPIMIHEKQLYYTPEQCQ